jgi:hypothetical protein
MWCLAHACRALLLVLALLAAAAALLGTLAGTALGARPMPNLAASATVAAPDASLGAGDRFTVRAVVVNAGNRRAARSAVAVAVVPLFGLARRVAVRAVPSVGPGGWRTAVLAGRLPDDAVDGQYRLVVCADADDRIAERDEADNCDIPTWPVARGAAGPASMPSDDALVLGTVPTIASFYGEWLHAVVALPASSRASRAARLREAARSARTVLQALRPAAPELEQERRCAIAALAVIVRGDARTGVTLVRGCALAAGAKVPERPGLD